MELKNHGAMRLTTARYFTPSGKSIQAKGITPDIEVKAAKVEEVASLGPGRREADLKGALSNPDTLKTDGKATTPAAPPAGGPGEPGVGATPGEISSAKPAKPSGANVNAPPEVDYQLSRALDLLRGVAMFNQRAVN
jgi:carboxyl-terminal processing protease